MTTLFVTLHIPVEVDINELIIEGGQTLDEAIATAFYYGQIDYSEKDVTVTHHDNDK